MCAIFTTLTLSIFWISSIDALSTNKSMNDGEVKRLKQIHSILQTLGLLNEVDNSGKYEKFQQSIDPQIVKRILLSSSTKNGKDEDSDEDKEMVFVWKMDKLIKQCRDGDRIKSLELQFLFNLRLFENSKLSSAFIYFYKKKQSPTEQILVKEVPNVGTHEYLINGGLFDKQGGWVQLDITRHVDYWTGDYGSELRTLKLECGSECTELYVEHCDSKMLPFLYIALKSKTEN